MCSDFRTSQVLQNGKPLVDGYTPKNNLITEKENESMKTEELKEKGLTEEQIAFVMEENGKDIKKLQSDKGKAESDRDSWKERAETAENTLKGFEGVDVDGMQKMIDEWKEKAENAEKEYTQKIYDRDFSDALKAEMENVKFSSEAAKKSVMAEVTEAGLKLSNGKILGLSDLIGQIKERDASAFVDEEQQKAQQQAARFTVPGTWKVPGGNGNMTKKDIFAIKDATERQKAIAENIELFGKGE